MNNTCYVCLWYHPETGKFARLGLHSEGPNMLTHDGRLVPLMVFHVTGRTFEESQHFAKGRIKSESIFEWLVPWLDAYVHGSSTPTTTEAEKALMAEYEQRIERLGKEYADGRRGLEEEIKRLQKRNLHLREENAGLLKDLKSCAESQHQKTSSDAEIKSLSDWCTSLETRLLVMEDQPQTLKNKVGDVEMRVQMLDQRGDARWGAYSEHMKALDERIACLEAEQAKTAHELTVANHDSEIKRLNKQNLHLLGDVHTRSVEITRLNEENRVLKERVERQRAEIHTFQTTLRKLLDGEPKQE